MICVECGGEMVESSLPIKEFFRGEGIIVEGVDYCKCNNCGEVVMDMKSAEKCSLLVDSEYRKRMGLLSPAAIREIRRSYGLTQEEFQRALGVGKTTVSRWETGKVIQLKPEDNLMRTMRDYPRVATELMERAEVRCAGEKMAFARQVSKINLSEKRSTAMPSDCSVEIPAGIPMQSCRLLRFNIVAGTPVSPGSEIELTNEIGAKRLDIEGCPSGLEMVVTTKANNGDFFFIDLALRVLFDMPVDASFSDKNKFLAEVAPNRVLDAIRPIVESATAHFDFGPVSLPPIMITLNSDDWLDLGK